MYGVGKMNRWDQGGDFPIAAIFFWIEYYRNSRMDRGGGYPMETMFPVGVVSWPGRLACVIVGCERWYGFHLVEVVDDKWLGVIVG